MTSNISKILFNLDFYDPPARLESKILKIPFPLIFITVKNSVYSNVISKNERSSSETVLSEDSLYCTF